jgi:hypothetical protein
MLEAGALGPTDAFILENRNDAPPMPLRNGLQVAPLIFHGLLGR